jgi:hypothetical protein
MHNNDGSCVHAIVFMPLDVRKSEEIIVFVALPGQPLLL